MLQGKNRLLSHFYSQGKKYKIMLHIPIISGLKEKNIEYCSIFLLFLVSRKKNRMLFHTPTSMEKNVRVLFILPLIYVPKERNRVYYYIFLYSYYYMSLSNKIKHCFIFQTPVFSWK